MSPSLTVVKNVCPHDCPDTCGLVVTVKDGRAISIKGDPDHPFTDGFLCQKVARYLDRVYHPGRLQYPMKRVGRKGEGRFERITWDEAIQLITERFRSIAHSADGPQAILPYSYAGTMGKLQGSSLDRRFFHRLGASLLDRTICATAGAVGCDITLGTRAVIDSEAVIHSRYIINWGSNTSVTNSHLWAIMFRARKSGAKIVTIDPHKSKTAQKSDWWIPLRPGTDGALALGMMHILFRDGKQDQDYLERYSLGWQQLRDRVLNDYTPEKVSQITGIPVPDIETLTREYANARTERGGPGFIRLNYGVQRHGGGGMAVRNITCLPAITGDWRYPGGGALLSTSRMSPFNSHALERPDLIPPGTRTINMVQLAEALAGELSGPPVKAMYVYNSNPAAVNPDQAKVLYGLKREDLFTVVHELFHTDTVDYADVVLPATSQLEHFDIHNAYGHYYIQVNPPAIAPLAECKSNNEVFRLLAKAMQFETNLFSATDEELAQESLQLNGSTKHYPPRTAFDGITFERLLQGGPVRLNLPHDHAPFAEGKFDTPSGKCEFYSDRLKQMGLDPIPTYIPPHEDPLTRLDLSARYPLQMICPPEPAFLNSSFVNVDALRATAREPRVEIHPQDATPRGITTGDTVRIFNDRGSFIARAQVGETVQLGTVVSFGVWWNKYTEDGVNCNTTTSTALTDLGGGATFFDNLVQVERLSR
jgi:anaerobic selenocysteine-containing dehydrogenase